MSGTAIKTQNLAKCYRLGTRGIQYKTLRDGLSGLFKPDKHSAVANPRSREVIWALKDVSFEVKQGQVMGVIGPNGSGKTTLLKILSRITEPTEGRAEIRGRVGSLLEIGTGFHPELTGRENVFLNGAILGMKRREIRSKFDEIVSFAGVERFVDTPVKFYSSGMYVRLAFSVAAHLKPEILLVDEVLAVGDVRFQEKCIGKMETIASEGRTVIVVSHNMSTVRALCSEAMLLENGLMRAIGPVGRIVDSYLGIGRADPVDKVLTDGDHNPHGGRDIRLRRIRLLDSPSNSFSVHWRQPISASLDIEVFRKITEVSFGASIRLRDGTYLFAVFNDDESGEQWVLEPGRYNIEFTLQNDLKPGLYTLNVGAHQSTPNFNLFSVDAVTIEVLGTTREGTVAPALNPGVMTGVKSAFSCKRP